jgi:tRNA (guanine37-N1)-methyltransferase
MDMMNHSILKRAVDKEIINVNCIDIRDFTSNKHRQVDDAPYGGGAGLVFMPEPVYLAVEHAKKFAGREAPVIYLTPQGRTYNQRMAEELSNCKNLILLCGHYEGIDQRVLDSVVTDEISLGDYILTGGELAALTVIDSVSRLIPGVLNKDESFADESFSDGLLEYPQYTRPQVFLDKRVPEILLSGNHQKIAEWRREQSISRTKKLRPDLFARRGAELG